MIRHKNQQNNRVPGSSIKEKLKRNIPVNVVYKAEF